MPFSTHKNRILYVLFGFFIANAVIAELISVKLFDFGDTIGLEKDTYIMALGLLPWPIVFLATDVVNEFYGKKIVKQLSVITSILLLYVFGVIYIANHMSAYNDGVHKKIVTEVESKKYENPKRISEGQYEVQWSKPGVSDKQFHDVYAQSGFLIIGSVIAFLIGQFIDISIFGLFKRFSKGKFIWLRATGSTIISQLADTIIVIGIGFYFPGKISGEVYFNMVITGYFIKLIFAVLLTPFIYIVHYSMRRFFNLESVNYEKD